MKATRLSYVALAFLPASPALSSVDVAGDRVTVETGHGHVVIDRGVVTGLRNKLTGVS